MCANKQKLLCLLQMMKLNVKKIGDQVLYQIVQFERAYANRFFLDRYSFWKCGFAVTVNKALG